MIPHFCKTGTHQLKSFCMIVIILAIVGCGGNAPQENKSVAEKPGQSNPAPQQAPLQQAAESGQPAQASPRTPSPIPTQNVEIDEASLRGITVNFWHTWPEEQIMPLVEEFNRTNSWGITIKPWYQSNSAHLSDNVRRALLENDAPQLTLGYTDQAADWDGQGNLANLDDFIGDHQWGMKADEQNDFLPIFWKYGLVDGKRLGIPALASGTYLFYNQSWANDLGFSTPPNNIQSFKEQVCAANAAMKKDKDASNDYAGGWMVSTDPSTILAWFYAFGADITSQSDKSVSQSIFRFDSQNTQDAFFYLRDLYDNKCVWVSTEEYADEEFVNRRALLVTGGPVDLPYQAVAFVEGNSTDKWTILPFPSTSGDPVVISQVPSFSIIRSKPEADLAAWLFARWMVDPSIQAKWSALTGYFPVRTAANDIMAEYAASHPQWTTARDLLKYARTEPILPSWGSVRWVLGDSGVQVFRPYFTADRIPLTLKELQSTSAEILDMGN